MAQGVSMSWCEAIKQGENSFVPSCRTRPPTRPWRAIERNFTFYGRSETIKSLVLISNSSVSVKREKAQKYSLFQ